MHTRETELVYLLAPCELPGLNLDPSSPLHCQDVASAFDLAYMALFGYDYNPFTALLDTIIIGLWLEITARLFSLVYSRFASAVSHFKDSKYEKQKVRFDDKRENPHVAYNLSVDARSLSKPGPWSCVFTALCDCFTLHWEQLSWSRSSSQ